MWTRVHVKKCLCMCTCMPAAKTRSAYLRAPPRRQTAPISAPLHSHPLQAWAQRRALGAAVHPHTCSALIIRTFSLHRNRAPNFSAWLASAPQHMQAEGARGQAFPLLPPSAWDLGYCYVYANSLWHNSFETVENWIVPLGQTFRPPPWLYSSATVNWVQRWLHTLYFRERLQLGNNFCTGKTNANSWQKHWSCLVVQPPIWRNTDCAENFFGHPRSK